MTTKNPWLGLASYEEPKNDGTDSLFCGRDDETLEMVRLIDNNLFVTLYGSSGIGKTSLLRAGVIPILRRKDYYPLYVRLSQEPKEISYAEAIVRKLQSSGLTEEICVSEKHTDANDRLFLWDYFATTRFLKEGREVYPVIILDQFEEVFRDGKKTKAELLLRQIYLLLNDELELPDEEGWSADTNYRFVASIREDFLFVLEDSIDENSLDLYKNNRYRLRPMKPEHAHQVVLKPGKDCIEETEKIALTERIIALSKRQQGNDIDTLMLSLVCAGTYEKKTGEKIVLSDLAIWKNNPMEVYYQDAIKRLTAKQIRYIQQHLIREDGSRRRVDEKEVSSVFGEATYEELTLGTNRLFAIGEKGQVELLHDQLGMAVYEERKAFEERERKKKLRQRITLISIIVLAIAGFFFLQNQKLMKQRTELETSQWTMLENQSRSLSNTILNLVSYNDSYLASLLSLEILPQDLDHPDRPFVVEAETALRAASYFDNATLRGHTGDVLCADYSPDGKQIVSSSSDSTIRIWDANTGQLRIKLTGHQGSVRHVAFSPNGKRVVSTSSDNTIRIWDIKTGKQLYIIKDSAYKAFLSSDSLCYSIYNQSVNVWNIQTKKSRKIVADSNAMILSLNFSKGANRYCTLTGNNISIWNTKTQKLLKTLHIKTMTPYRFPNPTLSPDGNLIAIENGDSIYIINTTDGKTMQSFNIQGMPSFLKIVFSSDGKRIAWTSSWPEAPIYYGDINNRETIKTTNGHSKSIYSLCFSPDGNKLISTSKDKTIQIWDLDGKRMINTMIENSGYVYSIAYSTDGKTLYSVSSDRTIRIWDVKTGELIDSRPCQGNFFELSSHGKYVKTLNWETEIYNIWNTEKGEYIQTVKEFNNKIFFSPDETFICSTPDSTLSLWDIQTGRLKNNIKCLAPSIESVSFSPTGNLLAAVCFNIDDIKSSVEIRNVKTGNLVKIIEDKTKYLACACFSQNEQYLATSSIDNITIWDLRTGEKYFETDDYNHIGTVVFNADDKQIMFTASNAIGIIDLALKKRTFFLTFDNAIYCTAVNPKENQFAVATENGTICLIKYPPLQQLINETRERFKNRQLTPEERRMYYLE